MVCRFWVLTLGFAGEQFVIDPPIFEFLHSRKRPMKQTYTAIVKFSDPWWIGWVEEIPGVNCQESSREELLESLRITLSEALEINRDHARHALVAPYEEHAIAV